MIVVVAWTIRVEDVVKATGWKADMTQKISKAFKSMMILYDTKGFEVISGSFESCNHPFSAATSLSHTHVHAKR